MKIEKCPFCLQDSQSTLDFEKDRLKVNCVRCGDYIITEDSIREVNNFPLNEIQKVNASGFIFENQNLLINTEKLEDIRKLGTPTINEKANKLLKYINKERPFPGQKISFKDLGYIDNIGFGLPLTWSRDIHEYSYIIHDYSIKELKILGTDNSDYWVTPHGWLYLEELKKSEIYSNIAFVALWINDATDELWATGIQPAIHFAGYEPYRVDKDNKVVKIDDEIFVKIKESKFVIADFTDQRHNVYYEAGFAKGLGKEVILTCLKDELDNKKVTFDIQQFRFIPWETDKLADFSRNLYFTIIKRIGYGEHYKTRLDKNKFEK